MRRSATGDIYFAASAALTPQRTLPLTPVLTMFALLVCVLPRCPYAFASISSATVPSGIQAPTTCSCLVTYCCFHEPMGSLYGTDSTLGAEAPRVGELSFGNLPWLAMLAYFFQHRNKWSGLQPLRHMADSSSVPPFDSHSQTALADSATTDNSCSPQWDSPRQAWRSRAAYMNWRSHLQGAGSTLFSLWQRRPSVKPRRGMDNSKSCPHPLGIDAGTPSACPREERVAQAALISSSYSLCLLVDDADTQRPSIPGTA
jgi:hypothetical protein